MANQSGQLRAGAGRFARRGLLIIGLLLVLIGVGFYFWRTYTVSEGSRTGTLFKISRKGIVFKTYEGQLHLGGSQFMSEQSVWDFSVKNGEVYQKLQQFEGKTVKLHYDELVNPFPWQGETKYIVHSAEPVQ
jgi:hypothetical protein